MDFVGNEQVRGGDIVTKIDNQPVKSMDDVISYLDESKKVGDKVTLTVNREGQDVEYPLLLKKDHQVLHYCYLHHHHHHSSSNNKIEKKRNLILILLYSDSLKFQDFLNYQNFFHNSSGE